MLSLGNVYQFLKIIMCTSYSHETWGMRWAITITTFATWELNIIFDLDHSKMSYRKNSAQIQSEIFYFILPMFSFAPRHLEIRIIRCPTVSHFTDSICLCHISEDSMCKCLCCCCKDKGQYWNSAAETLKKFDKNR